MPVRSGVFGAFALGAFGSFSLGVFGSFAVGAFGSCSSGVVGSFDKPLAIDFLDILKLFDAERKTEIEFLAENKKARQHLRKLAKNQPELQKIVDQLDIAGTISVPLDKHLAAA